MTHLLKLILLALFSLSLQAGDHIVLDYSYSGSASDPDFAKLKGTLAIHSFSDSRPAETQNELLAEAPLSAIITGAFTQAFIQNGATLQSENSQFELAGELTEISSSTKDNGVEVVIRAKIILRDAGRTRWEGTLLSRSTDATLVSATRKSINSLVQQLFLDDYFLMEII